MEKKRILVVDDDSTITEMLKTGLELLGYEVDTAENQSDFKIALATAHPDVILMDVSMPGMDGISLCRDIRFSSGESDIPIIMLTAFSDEKTYHDAMLFGATDFLSKPFEISEVQKKIELSLLKVRAKKEKPHQQI